MIPLVVSRQHENSGISLPRAASSTKTADLCFAAARGLTKQSCRLIRAFMSTGRLKKGESVTADQTVFEIRGPAKSPLTADLSQRRQTEFSDS